MREMIELWRELWQSNVGTYEKKSSRPMFINVVTQFLERLPRKPLFKLGIIVTLVLSFLITFIVGFALENVFRIAKGGMSFIEYTFLGGFFKYIGLFILLVFFMGAGVFLAWQKFIYNHQSLLEGHKGTARFTTPKEISEQYKAVPKKAEVKYVQTDRKDDYGDPVTIPVEVGDYEGLSGVLISRDEQKQLAYIDTGPAHNISYGRTRSGKTQAAVKANIDLYSRAEEKPHMIIASTKYELLSSSQDQLKARGYEINVLNLIDLDRSIGYNPLELIVKAFKNNDVGEAIELCKTFSYPLYHNKEAREPVWEETAMALVNAIILALCYEFLQRSDEERFITLYNVGQMIIELSGDDGSTGLSILDKYFDNLSPSNPARTEYSTVRLATGQMRSSIFASTQAKLRKFTAPKVAALLAKSTYSFDKLLQGYHKTLSVVRPRTANTANPIRFTILDKQENGEVVFSYDLVPGGKGVKHDELDVKAISEETDEFDVIVHDDRFVIIDFGDGEQVTYVVEKNKPQAVFICMPDYIETNSIVASTFIQQLYYVLSKHASSRAGDKLERRVRFVLDEFANLDAFSNIMSMLSVGAGRGILMDLYIQDDTQINQRYNVDISTFIRTQGMNVFFIQSSNNEMARAFSDILGTKEVISKSRSGTMFGQRTITETPEERPLMKPDELGRLKEGEVVVYRAGTRRNLKGDLIVPYPIHNDGNSRFVYEWEYMSDQFAANKDIHELDLPTVPDFDISSFAGTFSKKVKAIIAGDNKPQSSSKGREQGNMKADEEALATDPIKDSYEVFEAQQANSVPFSEKDVNDETVEEPQENKVLSELAKLVLEKIDDWDEFTDLPQFKQLKFSIEKANTDYILRDFYAVTTVEEFIAFLENNDVVQQNCLDIIKTLKE